MPIILVLVGRDRWIPGALWPASLAEMGSSRLVRNSVLKYRRRATEGRHPKLISSLCIPLWGSGPTLMCAHTYLYYTHRHKNWISLEYFLLETVYKDHYSN